MRKPKKKIKKLLIHATIDSGLTSNQDFCWEKMLA